MRNVMLLEISGRDLPEHTHNIVTLIRERHDVYEGTARCSLVQGGDRDVRVSPFIMGRTFLSNRELVLKGEDQYGNRTFNAVFGGEGSRNFALSILNAAKRDGVTKASYLKFQGKDTLRGVPLDKVVSYLAGEEIPYEELEHPTTAAVTFEEEDLVQEAIPGD